MGKFYTQTSWFRIFFLLAIVLLFANSAFASLKNAATVNLVSEEIMFQSRGAYLAPEKGMVIYSEDKIVTTDGSAVKTADAASVSDKKTIKKAQRAYKKVKRGRQKFQRTTSTTTTTTTSTTTTITVYGR